MQGHARRVSRGPSVAAGTRRSGCAPSRCSVIAQRGGLNIWGFLHTHKTAMVGNVLTPWGVIASFDRVYTSSSAPQCERIGPPGPIPTIRSLKKKAHVDKENITLLPVVTLTVSCLSGQIIHTSNHTFLLNLNETLFFGQFRQLTFHVLHSLSQGLDLAIWHSLVHSLYHSFI